MIPRILATPHRCLVLWQDARSTDQRGQLFWLPSLDRPTFLVVTAAANLPANRRAQLIHISALILRAVSLISSFYNQQYILQWVSSPLYTHHLQCNKHSIVADCFVVIVHQANYSFICIWLVVKSCVPASGLILPKCVIY